MSEQQTPYELLGGAEGLRALVDQFYTNVASCSEAEDIRRMHKADMSEVAQKLFEYLSGWLGGPGLYMERYGTVCITKPHAPFAIGVAARDQWIFCFRKALDDVGASEEVKVMLHEPIHRIADFLRNRED